MPGDLQAIVTNACKAVNIDLLSEFTARNNAALHQLVTEHKVELRNFPENVLKELRGVADKVVAELADRDPMAERIFTSFRKFREQVTAWNDISERAYLNTRV